VKPLPRYFWMVFALAGDSTMTKPLANVSSMDDFVFEASTNAKLATSFQRAALGSWPLAFGLKPMPPERFSVFAKAKTTCA
jgi:hypothetical protein